MQTIEEHDSSIWLSHDTLQYVAHYDHPEPHRFTYTLVKSDPCGDRFCYWCAIGGQCFALATDDSTCIATIQHALMESDLPRKGGWLDANYVIWQPKVHTKTVWDRWQKKWSARTAL